MKRPGLNIACAALLCLPSPGLSQSTAMEVIITNLKADSGVVLVNVETEASWFRSGGRAVRSLRVTPRGRTARVVIEGIAAGRYAIRVHHDENGDGRFNKGLFGIPVERYGFSGRASGFGPPGFDAAAFPFPAQASIRIRLR